MNTELMKIVERAIRPVRATHKTKLRMREELYSLLELIYREELANDAETALANAARRFGPPEVLQAELQQAVSRAEAVFVSFDRWFVRRRPGESLFRLALRIGSRMSLALALYFGILIGLLDALTGRNAAGDLWPLLTVVCLLFGINAFLMTLLGQGASAAFVPQGKSLRLARPWRLLAFSVLAGLCIGVSESILWGTSLGYFSVATQVEPFSGATIGGSGIFALVIYLLAREDAKIQPWQSLELEIG